MDWLSPLRALTGDHTCHPRYFPWPEIKPTNFCCTGRCSNQLSNLAMARHFFKELKKSSLLYLHWYLPFLLFFHSWFSKFPSDISLLSEEISFSNSFRICLLVANSLSFPSSEKGFISLLFLKDISLDIEFWAYNFFSWETFCHFLQPLWFPVRNLLSLECYSSVG